MTHSDNTNETTTFTKIFFCDLNGRIMNLSVNQRDLESIEKHGVGFDGSSIAGFASVENSDRLLFPVKTSEKKIRFNDESIDFFIGKILNEHGERSETDARAILENVLQTAEKKYGVRFLVGPEHEFFLLNGNEFELSGESIGEKSHSDKAGYCHAQPHNGNAYEKRIESPLLWDERFLPKSLYEALVEAERSDFLREVLGDTACDNYIRLKTDEWEEHRTHITPREHQKYLNL